MKDFYKTLYKDVRILKKQMFLLALCLVVIYGVLTFGGSSHNAGVQTASLIATFLMSMSLVLLFITTPQHGIRNQKSIVFVTFALFVVLALSVLQAIYAISQGDGLYEQVINRDASGAVTAAQLTLQPVIPMIALVAIWLISVHMSNRIERKLKVIKGIQDKKLFK